LNWANPQPTELLVDTPFDYARQALLYTPPAGRLPADPNLPAYTPAAAQEIARLVRLAGGGHTLCLFASYNALRQVAELLPYLVPGVSVLAQGADLSRDAIVAQFRAAQGRRLVILGAKSFWEGVSLEGDQLRMVIVERVMFTPPGPVQLAKQADLEAHGGNWFRDLALPEALAALRQGVGRLIRTTTDRGVVALLDPRLNTRPWGKQVLSALPPFARTADIQAVHTFLTR
jgi:ATP-dependent DNA helicase DinG